MSGWVASLGTMTPQNINARPDTAQLPAELAAKLDEDAPEALDFLWSNVISGYLEAVDLSYDVVDIYELEDSDIPLISQAVSDIVAARKNQIAQLKAAGFTGETNLNAAFTELRAYGVLALANFSCCGNCGSDEAWSEMQDDPQARAYLFFHEQDTERLLESRGTYLGFGYDWHDICPKEEFEKMNDATRQAVYQQHIRALADEVLRPTFAKYGIDFDWNGDVDTRMYISNVDYFVDITQAA